MITSSVVSQINVKFSEIETCLLNEYNKENNLGLMNGKAGIAIFFSLLKKYSKSNKYDDIIEECIVDSMNLDNYSIVTFCSGVTGALWAADLLKKNQILDLQEDFTDINTEISKTILDQLKKGNIDFLHGAIGNMLALVDMDYGIFAKNETVYLQQLRALGEENENHIKWKTRTEMSSEKKPFSYNSSLSHGSSSIIILLSEILNKNKKSGLTRELLIKACNYILSTKNIEIDTKSLYPSIVFAEDGSKSGSSRLAWCYGDLGVGMALFKAGNVLGNLKFKKEGLDILLFTTTLKSKPETLVKDACICHGCAGIAMIYKSLFKQTGIPEFRDSANYWLNETIEQAVFNRNECAGYQFHNGITSKYESGYSMLEGLAGVGLVLFSFLNDEDFGWERCFLLD